MAWWRKSRYILSYLNTYHLLKEIFILVDVPAEFDITSIKEDFVDHHIVASKVECIELLRLKPLVSSSP
jgi:hypothetical protein